MTRLTALLLVIASTAIGRTAPAATTPFALSEFFEPGVVFQDRNHDGVADFVDARIVVPGAPTAAEAAAAADVAARLGYETTAMNLPIVYDAAKAFEPGDAPTVFIGGRTLARAELTAEAIGGSGLR